MKKQKIQDNYKTPNEKFNAEFAEENSSQKSTNAQNSNYKTPNEKFDEEFKEKN
ncbi:hypothetical protein P4H66_02140 [Paenibacillus dokdonensis]|uniref:Uncharacterized protein n=1 Tax=Paenibacillus dokdonensis TaxID=2567944 RepID=A0ABU6GHK4_9BACL|nr:hypothetical protein [Paenibacillus dokdonensis]MEC0238673.1 hypothetical protein [Paenibacillus dokdonensis]